MFSPALLDAIDRVLDALMGVARAVTAFGIDRSNPAEPASAARTMLHCVTVLVIRLIRLSNNGLPPRREPNTTPADPAPDRTNRDPVGDSGLFLPRRPGWLLDALPDDAPALAAQLAAALADPELAPLLAAVPALARELRPVLRVLGLAAPAVPSPDLPPDLPPRDTPPTDLPTRPTLRPSSPPPSSSTRPIEAAASNELHSAAPSHAQFVTI